jgi:hypothetical protein
MRAADSGRIKDLPGHLRPFAEEAKASFDHFAREEMARGILEHSRQDYFTHILTGVGPENWDALQAARAKWVEATGLKRAPKGQAAKRAAFIKAELAKGVPEATAAAKWERRAGKLSKTHRFAKARTLDTFEDLERFVEYARKNVPGMDKLDIERDWVKALGVRELAHQKAMQNWDMLASLKTLGDDLVMDAKVAPVHFVDPPIPQLAGVKVSPQVARWLSDFKEPFTNIESLRGFLGAFDKATNVWKGLATAARPGFHIRNAVSNVFNNWLGGVRDPVWYVQAGKLQRAAGKGSEALAAVKVGGKTGTELWDEVVKSGVVGQGWIGADVGQTLGEAARLGRVRAGTAGRGSAIVETLKHPVVTGRRVGTAIEDNARIAHYLAKRAEGLTPDQALLSVKNYLFDYEELTAFERNVLKRAIPFVTWARKNIPLQFAELCKQPGIYSKVGAAKRFVEDFSDGLDEDDLPGWMKDQFAVRLPFQFPTGQAYASLDLPLQDLQLPSLSEVFSMLNPLLKVPIEQAVNTEFFSGRPIEDSPGEYVEAPGYLWAADLAAANTPGVSSWWPQLREKLGLREVYEDGRRELRMPARTRHVVDQIVVLRDVGRLIGAAGGQVPLEKLGSPYLGVGLYSMSPEKAGLSRAYDENRALRGRLATLASQGVEVPTNQAGKGLFGKRTKGSGGLFGRS